ncbi:Tau tubulin kinase 1 [Trichuris trichiura]|uniref:Tau tubulin kinase 1 n=1 Tax=Trichuris trichiura TaxID=36087 RepID=A0A077Z4W1_TRITR|nr:Tau tubulin kinase 1 [Trichuris trichiura]
MGGGGEEAGALLHEGDCVDDRWMVEKVLGKGGFGAVYEVFDKNLKKYEAMKIELNAQDFRTLKLEVVVLKELNGRQARHVCQLFGIGKKTSYCFIVMTLVGPSFNSMLESLRPKFPDGRTRFTLRSCLHLAQKSLESLQDLHLAGYLHRDIKPQNFATGRPPDYRDVFCLDFGMCRKYVKEDGKLRRPREKVGFRGTLYYASVDVLKGEEQARKDDLWSWYFMLVRMTVGQVPWRTFCPPRNASVAKQAAAFGQAKSKALASITSFCEGCPAEFIMIGEHLNILTYYDEPNYELCYNQLNAIMQRKNYQEWFPLDWEQEGEYHAETVAAPMHDMMPNEKNDGGD